MKQLLIIIAAGIFASIAANEIVLEESFESGTQKWHLRQSGPSWSKCSFLLSPQGARTGDYCIAIDNSKNSEGTLIYRFSPPLPAGDYYLEFYARSEPGKAAILQGWLGMGYTEWTYLGEQWTKVCANVTVKEAVNELIIWAGFVNGHYYVDDVLLEKGSREIPVVPPSANPEYTTKPVTQKTIVFQPINVVEYGDNAQWFADHGISGSTLRYIMEDNETDVWASDGDPATRTPADDKLFKEVLACNEKCAAAGVDRNFMSIGFNKIPDMTSRKAIDEGAEKMRQAAIFAKAAKFRGIGLDFEYAMRYYHLSYYKLNNVAEKQLLQNARYYGRAMANVMYSEFPEMELLIIWENVMFAGSVSHDILLGMFDAVAERNAPGGISVFCEGISYQVTNADALQDRLDKVKKFYMQSIENPSTRSYLEKKLDFALGMWPFSNGYGDNHENYSVELFKEQIATARKLGGRYNWLYIMPNGFSPQTDESARKYRGKTVHRYWPEAPNKVPAANPNLEKYGEILRSDIILK